MKEGAGRGGGGEGANLDAEFRSHLANAEQKGIITSLDPANTAQDAIGPLFPGHTAGSVSTHCLPRPLGSSQQSSLQPVP